MFNVVILVYLCIIPCESFDGEHVYRIVEELPVKHLIGTFHSMSVSSTRLQNQYNIVAKDSEVLSIFEINNRDGDLRIKRKIDRDTLCTDKRLCCSLKMSQECEIKFRVIMRNEGSQLNSKYFRVRIIIEDINDNVPKFTNTIQRMEMSETTTIGTMLYLPLAVDEDAGRNSIQLYTLTGDTTVFRLLMVTVSEVIYPRLELIESIDRETVSKYNLNLCAHDGGRPVNIGCTKIDVIIMDSNDNPPIINQQSLSFKIPKRFDQLQKVGSIIASDKDEGNNALLRYYISELAPLTIRNRISLDARNGDIRLIQKLNYETSKDIISQMIIPILVTDSGTPSLSATGTLTIQFEDSNEESPLITITDLTGKVPPRPQIFENKVPGQIVAFVHVVDSDPGLDGHVDCNLVESPYFRLIMESGQRETQEKEYKIESKQSLDRELHKSIELVLVCEDKGNPSRTSRQTIVISVLDENDNYPVFHPNPVLLNVKENIPINSVISHLNITDADSYTPGQYQVTCKMDQDDSEYVSIDRSTCSLRTRKAIDREVIEKIVTQVVAVDNGSPPKQTVAQILISILDENDNKPDFHRESLEYSVKENQQPAIIAKLIAQDPDDGKNGEVTYQLSFHDNAAHNAFGIDATSGNLFTKIQLDREKRKAYEFEVIAMDNGKIRLASSATVKVIVEDLNDNKPKLIYPSLENRSHSYSLYNVKGTHLIKVTATDIDEGLNKDIIYEIISGNQNGIFQLDPSSGQMYLARDLQITDSGTYTIKVEARDNGDPPLRDIGVLRITFDTTSRIIPNLDRNRGSIHKFRSESDDKSFVLFGRNIMLIVCVFFVALLVVLVVVVMLYILKKRQSLHSEAAAANSIDPDNKIDPIQYSLNPDQINITNNNLWNHGYNTLQSSEKPEDQYLPLSPSHSVKQYSEDSTNTYQKLIRRNDNVMIQMSPVSLVQRRNNSSNNSPLHFTNNRCGQREGRGNAMVIDSPGLSLKNRHTSTSPDSSRNNRSNDQINSSSFV